MGQAKGYRCSRCMFTFTASYGAGFNFLAVYQGVMKAAAEGKCGEQLQRFVLDHPEGAINCESSVILCDRCGSMSLGPDFSMYIPRDGFDPSSIRQGCWSGATPHDDVSYVSPRALKENYVLFARYPHLCEKCGSGARAISERSFIKGVADGTIVCPCCGSALEADDRVICWD